MIKKFGALLILLISNFMLSQNVQEYRALMGSGENSKSKTELLIEKSNTAYNKTKAPIYAGFLAVGNFFMAKHTFNPLKKMSYFKEGKKLLEGAINTDPNNLELKLMRLITQEKVPKILGYHQKIEEDRNFLKLNYKNTNDQDLKKFIKEYLKL